mgnify:CR=1 FL=1
MIYDGVLSRLLSIDMGQMEKALRKQMGKKEKAIALNMSALKARLRLRRGEPAEARPVRRRADGRQDRGDDPDRRQRRRGHRLHDGGRHLRRLVSDHAVLVALRIADRLPEEAYRKDPETGKATYAVIQAEDEIAALGMVIGAGWMGARAMTSTAGPGLSLMAEFTGLGYYAEVPAVIFDVQRAGHRPACRRAPASRTFCRLRVLSHGDTKHPLLLPCSVDRVLRDGDGRVRPRRSACRRRSSSCRDLDLGMNTWMSKPFDYPTQAASTAASGSTTDTLKQLGEFARYRDVDGDGIPYRTVPGDGGPSFFTRGSGHNEKALYSERADDYTNNLDRLAKKFDTAPHAGAEARGRHGRASGGVGIIAYGTSHWALIETRDQLKNEQKLDTSYFRLRGYPFSKEIFDFIDAHERVYVVDQNRDGQMWSPAQLECTPPQVAKLRSIKHYYGLPIDGRSLTDELLKQEGR